MEFKIVDFKNVKVAIEVQKSIFLGEDGTINLLASLDRDLFMKKTGVFYINDNVKYYLAYYNENPIGITGIYCYSDLYPNDAWLGWYGVKEGYRNKGYGKELLTWTINKAREMGYKHIRLYTDENENKEAINLYEKMGFAGEKYLGEELLYSCYIYSKSLTSDPLEPWDNKIINLGYQHELDHFDDNGIKEILNKYKEEIT
jgi:Acetyltransferases